MPQKYVFLAAQDVFSINRIVYVLGWIRFPAPFDPEEVLRCLTQMMVLKGLQSDPSIPGTEQFCLAPLQRAWLADPPMIVTNKEIGVDKGLLPPHQSFAVKGWNRSVGCLLVLLATFQSKELREAGPALLQLSSNLIKNYLQILILTGNAKGYQGDPRQEKHKRLTLIYIVFCELFNLLV